MLVIPPVNPCDPPPMAHYVILVKEYPPDPTAVGQHAEGAAVMLGQRGHRVTVYTNDRDNDNPSIRYSNESRHPNVRVKRLPLTSFGKRTIFHRLLGQSSYLLQVFFRLLFKWRVDGVILTTAPPTIGLMYLVLRAFRPFKTLYWVMDLNPDQAVAAGIFQEGSLPVRTLRWTNRKLIDSADRVVVMDRFMRKQLLERAGLPREASRKVETIPPWPLEDNLRRVPREENPFIEEHGLADKRCVFMYSGNHSLVHPLDTLLEAIREVQDREDLAFLFIGGGRGKASVERFIEEAQPKNVRSLPYQPLERLSYSLSAADVQIVVMGEAMVGMVHPCKIYGAMAIGKPVLYVGPLHSHLGELVSLCGFGWCVEQGDVEGLARIIDEIAAMPRAELAEMGAKGAALIHGRESDRGHTLEGSYSAKVLAGKFCDLVEAL